MLSLLVTVSATVSEGASECVCEHEHSGGVFVVLCAAGFVQLVVAPPTTAPRRGPRMEHEMSMYESSLLCMSHVSSCLL